MNETFKRMEEYNNTKLEFGGEFYILPFMGFIN